MASNRYGAPGITRQCDSDYRYHKSIESTRRVLGTLTIQVSLASLVPWLPLRFESLEARAVLPQLQLLVQCGRNLRLGGDVERLVLPACVRAGVGDAVGHRGYVRVTYLEHGEVSYRVETFDGEVSEPLCRVLNINRTTDVISRVIKEKPRNCLI